MSHQESEKWRQMDEKKCEVVLEINPFDNFARFRLSQILIGQERDLPMAERLIESIQNNDPRFMPAECYELLGDLAMCE